MSQSSDNACNESKQHQNHHHQQTSSEVKYNASDIEKLYLQIKEDWL